MSIVHPLQELHKVFDDEENNLIFEQNVSIPRKSGYPIRCNVYRPRKIANTRLPVLVTYGPYGKDIPYSKFQPKSFSELNPEHKSKYSAWETPDPVFWTKAGYIVVRADERGLGQSPGLLDTMSRGTSECFFDVVEWAAEQEWSSGKVGLLGISYYAGTQWRVAARRPKGLAAIVPWEGMSDYYRDRCRHGGIYSDGFIKFWWDRQVITNQYGRPNRADWTGDTIEGDLPEDVLVANRKDQTHDNRVNKFRDEDYYSTTDFNLEDIEVPLLSVANWGGILLHLRGNVEGYTWAGSKNKWLRFIVGRHDLPFYYKEEVEVQKSFLDAFLKGQDSQGWTIPGKIAPVSMVLRKGNIGFNNPEFEANYVRREERAWPIPRTEYRKYFLHTDGSLTPQSRKASVVQRMSYEALGTLDNPKCIQFTTPAFEKDTEITGHVVAHLNLSMTPEDANNVQSSVNIDVFVTLRYLGPTGEEVHYTGTAGDPVPLTKGWLRMSLRKVDDKNSKHREYLPYRNYFKDEVEMLQPEVCYSADVEVWPTNVIAEKGGRLVFEVSSGDTQGCGIFQHTDKDDRSKARFGGLNHLHFGDGCENYIVLPFVPEP